MKTGRRDSKESYEAVVEQFIPNHNDSLSLVLSRFQDIGIDPQATVALLGLIPFSSTSFFFFQIVCFSFLSKIQIHFFLIQT